MLDENRQEVELMEISEYGNTDLNAIIAGDKDFAFEDSESFSKRGFSKVEFDEDSEELVAVDEDEDEESDDLDDFGAEDFDDDALLDDED